MNGPNSDFVELHRLQVDHGREWRIWRSTPTPDGRSGWYATRRRYLEPDHTRGLWPTLGADTAEELRQQLDAQALAAQTPKPEPPSASCHTVNPILHELMRWGIPGYGSYMMPEAFQ